MDLDAKSLSIDEMEFQESMKEARLAKITRIGPSPAFDDIAALAAETESDPSTGDRDKETNIGGRSNYPFMEAAAGELTVGDVESLLNLYKDVVTKYTSLCTAVRRFSGRVC